MGARCPPIRFLGRDARNPSKPDHVFLEAAPCFSSNALLLCAYGSPTIFAHPAENGGSRKKTIPFRNAFDWLGSDNTGSKTAHFLLSRTSVLTQELPSPRTVRPPRVEQKIRLRCPRQALANRTRVESVRGAIRLPASAHRLYERPVLPSPPLSS